MNNCAIHERYYKKFNSMSVMPLAPQVMKEYNNATTIKVTII
jgi:hypothetical protein